MATQKYYSLTEASFNLCLSSLRSLPLTIPSPRIVIENSSFQIWREVKNRECIFRISSLDYLCKKQKTTKIDPGLLEFRALNFEKLYKKTKHPIMSVRDGNGNCIDVVDYLI